MFGDIYVGIGMCMCWCTCTCRCVHVQYVHVSVDIRICCSPQTGQQKLSCLGTATDLLDVSKQHCEPS